MDPDKVVFSRDLQNLCSKSSVNALIIFPPGRLIAKVIWQGMQQRPDAGVREALVEPGCVFFTQKNRDTAILLSDFLLDFQALALVGKSSAGPTYPFCLMRMPVKSFQSCHKTP